MADPQKCHDEAERLREEAAESDSHDVRGTMLDIAELYYRLAETVERQRRGRTMPDSLYFREKARRCRAMAKIAVHPEVRAELFQLAEDFEYEAAKLDPATANDTPEQR
jgi:hypothetical protein